MADSNDSYAIVVDHRGAHPMKPLTVEQALAELWEMFGGQNIFPPYFTAGFNPDKNWETSVTINLVVNDVGQWFTAPTLEEAMAQVRAYWKETPRVD